MRIALLYDADLPFADTSRVDLDSLCKYLSEIGTVDQIDSEGDIPSDADVLVMAHGSCFPKTMWTKIKGYLSTGGNLVYLGGKPFSRPVRKDDTGGWLMEIEQSCYHKELLIRQVLPEDGYEVVRYDTPFSQQWLLGDIANDFPKVRTWGLQVRFVDTKYNRTEHGSTGPRLGKLLPFLWGIDAEGDAVTAPVVQMEYYSGCFAGGRWVFCPCDLPFGWESTKWGANLVKRLIEHSSKGALSVKIYPTLATYNDGEQVALDVHVRAFCALNTDVISLHLEIRRDDVVVREEDVSISCATMGDSSMHQTSCSASRVESCVSRIHDRIPIGCAGTPGLYEVRIRIDTGCQRQDFVTGFWVYDADLLHSASSISMQEDYFLKNGCIMPVVGTTYMAGDVSRSFIFEPNPIIWDCDFARMKSKGINMIRTGVWTGWRQMMPEPGRIPEEYMRAWDAFLLTAAKYDIPVIINLFAFLPDGWGGDHAYLDSLSMDAQKEYVLTFVKRYKGLNHVIWDLINEPSFSSEERVWNISPSESQNELRSWQEWLRQRHENPSELAEKWRIPIDSCSSFESISLPQDDEFRNKHIYQGLFPLKSFDYYLFAHSKFNAWIDELYGLIKRAGNPRHLVTVGQDEGGHMNRLSPLIHWDHVDFTCIHNWWENDSLLWDSVLAKVPDRPMLVQESGIMFLEDIDGGPARSEEDCRNLLERKFAYSFAQGGAGVIQWLWNTNCYMDSDNEVGIGYLRADSTKKLEMSVQKGFADFFEKMRPFMSKHVSEDTVMVVPHSLHFSVRGSTENITRRTLDIFQYHLNIPISAVGEYDLDALTYLPRLIVIPAAQVLMEQAWQQLLTLCNDGCVLLITGPVVRDEYWMNTTRFRDLGFEYTLRRLSCEEPVVIEGKEYMLDYKDYYTRNFSALRFESRTNFIEMDYGKGKVIVFSHPIEVSGNTQAVEHVYRVGVQKAEIESLFEPLAKDSSVYVGCVRYEDASLYLAVSEASEYRNVRIKDFRMQKVLEFGLAPGRVQMLGLDNSGTVICSYGQKEKTTRV